MKTVDKVIKSFNQELKDIYPLTEIKAMVQIVFEQHLKLSKTELITKQDKVLTEKEIELLNNVLLRLKNSEPLQYILGETYFYDLKLNIGPGVLIPRQETEELVEWIIKENINLDKLKVLDIGTGSGCIAIALASNLDNAEVYAYDISIEALEIANSNAKLNQQKVFFVEKDILMSSNIAENQQFDFIVSNPPYVLEKEKKMMSKNVLEFEPALALFVENDDPLLFYKAIVSYSKLNLKEGGKLYFEINEAYGREVLDLLKEKGFINIDIRQDLNGKERMIRGTI